MTLKLYNSRSRKKEVFEPLNPANVRMYVCGPTVYDRAHIGNARPVVVFDVLYRLLRHHYGEGSVTYVRNFTDVDDKINAKSAEIGRDIRSITDETIGWYHEDMDALGALRPTHEPRATEYITQMVEMIEGLIASGNAYEAEGHVLFAVSTDAQYGSLSNRPLDEMRAGARVEVAPYKRDPMDFVLWKPSDETQPGWDSPWGKGRPGWHIECSAMSNALLGESFDIHGGGIDLVFPHHENECAQSRCSGHGFANVWMHNGYLMVEGEKMSKSLGNFFTVADLREKGVPGEVMRLAMLMTHYRSPIDWTEKRLIQARMTLDAWYEIIGDCEPAGNQDKLFEILQDNIFKALNDDLNTHSAINELHKFARSSPLGVGIASITVSGTSRPDPEIGPRLKAAANLLGLLTMTRSQWIAESLGNNPDVSDEVEQLIEERKKAKSSKNYQKADEIRDELTSSGIGLRDTQDGTEWKILPNFDIKYFYRVVGRFN